MLMILSSVVLLIDAQYRNLMLAGYIRRADIALRTAWALPATHHPPDSHRVRGVEFDRRPRRIAVATQARTRFLRSAFRCKKYDRQRQPILACSRFAFLVSLVTGILFGTGPRGFHPTRAGRCHAWINRGSGPCATAQHCPEGTRRLSGCALHRAAGRSYPDDQIARQPGAPELRRRYTNRYVLHFDPAGRYTPTAARALSQIQDRFTALLA